MKIKNLIIGVLFLLSAHHVIGQQVPKQFKPTKEVFLIDQIRIYKKFYSSGSYQQLKSAFMQPANALINKSLNPVSIGFVSSRMTNLLSNAVVSNLLPHRLTGIQLAGEFLSKGVARHILIMTSGNVIIDLSRDKVFKITNENDRKYLADLVSRAS